MRIGVTVPLINTGVLSDVDLLLEAFKEKHSVRLVKFYEVAVEFELCNIYAGRLNIPELLEFEECFLRAAFDYARPTKESKMGDISERSLTERIFGIYATYVLYYAQPTDYASKILATPLDLIDLKHFVTDVLLPGRHLDTIGCIYKLLTDDAFSVGAFKKCYDPACHRGYTVPFCPDDVVDDDERHVPLEATDYIMEHPVLKTMAHVQREMELKQSQVSSRPIAAEIGDNFLNRLNKIYSSLKCEIDKVGVIDTEEADPDDSRDENGVNDATVNREPAQELSRSSIKDKAYGSTIQYARNRRYADPKMHENFPDAGNDVEDTESQIALDDQPVAEVPPPPKKKRKPKPKPPTTEPPPSVDDAASECSTKKVASSKQRQKVKAPKRTKGAAKALSEAEQPESSNPPAVERDITESDRAQSTSSRKPTRPPVDAEFEAEMKQIEKLLDDSQSQRAKELLG